MASTDIEIVNRALALLGTESITALTDNSKQASAANTLFNDSRASVFRAHPWNCLTRRASLPKDSVAPVFEFTNKFVLPADYLRLLGMEEPLDKFQIEGRFILSDDDALNIIYTALITDVTTYDTLLIDALASRIAADLAQPLLNSTAAMESMWRMYELKLREAKFVDAQENAQDVLDADYWLDSRLGARSTNIDTPPR